MASASLVFYQFHPERQPSCPRKSGKSAPTSSTVRRVSSWGVFLQAFAQSTVPPNAGRWATTANAEPLANKSEPDAKARSNTALFDRQLDLAQDGQTPGSLYRKKVPTTLVQSCLLSNPAVMSSASQAFKHKAPLNLLGNAAIGGSSAVAANAVTEDRNLLGYIRIGPRIYGLGVIIDGHSGPEAAEYVVKHIPVAAAKAIEAEYEKLNISPEEIQLENSRVISAMKTGLENAFVSLDARLRIDMEIAGKPRVGACCAVSIITDKRIITANAGDCAVVLAWPDVNPRRSRSPYTAVEPLSERHNCSEPAEVERLRALHPNDPNLISIHRHTPYLKGMLQPTRAFGDFFLKDAPPGRPPYLTVVPTISVREYSGSRHQPHILILATDGIWDRLSPIEAAEAALVPLLASVPSKNPNYTAPNLIAAEELELTSAQTAANSIVLTSLGVVAWGSAGRVMSGLSSADAQLLGASIGMLLNIPPPERRRLMDDMTVGVINLPLMRETLRQLNLPTHFHEHQQVVDNIYRRNAEQGMAVHEKIDNGSRPKRKHVL